MNYAWVKHCNSNDCNHDGNMMYVPRHESRGKGIAKVPLHCYNTISEGHCVVYGYSNRTNRNRNCCMCRKHSASPTEWKSTFNIFIAIIPIISIDSCRNAILFSVKHRIHSLIQSEDYRFYVVHLPPSQFIAIVKESGARRNGSLSIFCFFVFVFFHSKFRNLRRDWRR